MIREEEVWRVALEEYVHMQTEGQKRDRIGIICDIEDELKCMRRRELSILVDIQTRIDILEEMRLVKGKKEI